MIDLRRYLTRHRVEWIDHGANTSKNFLNIRCPFCGNQDKSYHLRIHIDEGWWYCLRAAGQHKGRTLPYLFKHLGISDIPAELGASPQVLEPKQERVVARIYADNYSNFDPATTTEALSYLGNRGFDYPEEMVRKFDLRVVQNGRWAGRLLIPLTIGWTGRSMRQHISPRYVSETDEGGFFRHGKGTSALVVEGPLDGMKICAVSNDFLVLGMTGGRISSTMLMALREAKPHTVYLVPDADVSASHRVFLLSELRVALPTVKVVSTKLPVGFKDPGEMKENEVRQWLYTI